MFLEIEHRLSFDYDAFVRSEIEKWRPIVRASGATVE